MDQNECAVRGVRYVAREEHTCEGCAFQRGSQDCLATGTYCSPYDRRDGRSIIWIRADQQPDAMTDPGRIEAAFAADQEAEDSRPAPLPDSPVMADAWDMGTEPVSNVKAEACACFPGTCRGGEVLNGRTAAGQRCKATLPASELRAATAQPAANPASAPAAVPAGWHIERRAGGEIAIMRKSPALSVVVQQVSEAHRVVPEEALWALADAILSAYEAAKQAGEQALPPYTSERHFALREGHEHRAEEDYFSARPKFDDNIVARSAFNAGYVRGFDKATELADARAAQAAQPLPVRDEREAFEVAFYEARQQGAWDLSPQWAGFQAGAKWQASLAQQPAPEAAKGVRNDDAADRLLREVFALCEATEDAPETEPKNEHQAGFDRGRRFEAKHIRRGIGTWFQDTFCGRSFMGEPVLATPPAPEAAKGFVLDAVDYAASMSFTVTKEWVRGWDDCLAFIRAQHFAATPPAPEAQQADEWETRADGQRVRKDRWQWGIRRIVALLWGNRQQFEIDEVVDAVRALVPMPHVDDEALAHAVQEGAAEPQQPAQAVPLTPERVAEIRKSLFERIASRYDGCDDETWDELLARAIERACASAWGVKLAGGGEGV